MVASVAGWFRIALVGVVIAFWCAGRVGGVTGQIERASQLPAIKVGNLPSLHTAAKPDADMGQGLSNLLEQGGCCG